MKRCDGAGRDSKNDETIRSRESIEFQLQARTGKHSARIGARIQVQQRRGTL